MQTRGGRVIRRAPRPERAGPQRPGLLPGWGRTGWAVPGAEGPSHHPNRCFRSTLQGDSGRPVPAPSAGGRISGSRRTGRALGRRPQAAAGCGANGGGPASSGDPQPVPGMPGRERRGTLVSQGRRDGRVARGGYSRETGAPPRRRTRPSPAPGVSVKSAACPELAPNAPRGASRPAETVYLQLSSGRGRPALRSPPHRPPALPPADASARVRARAAPTGAQPCRRDPAAPPPPRAPR